LLTLFQLCKTYFSKIIKNIHNASNLLGIATRAFLTKKKTFNLYGMFPNYEFWGLKNMLKALKCITKLYHVFKFFLIPRPHSHQDMFFYAFGK